MIFFMTITVYGQDKKYQVSNSDYQNQKVEMADAMRANGKIYVVIGVIMIIFAGMVFYLVRSDKKLTELEKLVKEHIDHE